MEELLDIAEVARRAGVSSRALRFYEARGLLAPLRTASGRRAYGVRALDQLNQLLALKRAGLSLAEIGRMLGRGPVDLARIVDAQLEAIAARTAELIEARALLLSVKSHIGRGEPVDVATFCSLIEKGHVTMEGESWKTITERYFNPGEQAQWAEAMLALPGGFDQERYNQSWRELGARIEAAMPMAPMSAEAQAFVDEWFALLRPFTQVATPGIWNGTVRMYDDMDSWRGEADPGFSKAVWDLVRLATSARIAAGGSIEGSRQ